MLRVITGRNKNWTISYLKNIYFWKATLGAGIRSPFLPGWDGISSVILPKDTGPLLLPWPLYCSITRLHETSQAELQEGKPAYLLTGSQARAGAQGSQPTPSWAGYLPHLLLSQNKPVEVFPSPLEEEPGEGKMKIQCNEGIISTMYQRGSQAKMLRLIIRFQQKGHQGECRELYPLGRGQGRFQMRAGSSRCAGLNVCSARHSCHVYFPVQ